LYKTFPAPYAREPLASALKYIIIHNTPKHGSWLNIAEISISILTKQCIDPRIKSLELLNSEIAAWEAEYNSTCMIISWQFTTDITAILLSAPPGAIFIMPHVRHSDKIFLYCRNDEIIS
jgi:hypothetical protein